MSSDLVLSTKRAVLSSGGTRYNGLYYNQANSSVELLECTFGYPYQVSLSSSSFGSSSTIAIPINEFVDNFLLHLRLPNIQENESLAPGWGYRMLNNISYSLGASNTTQIVLQKDAILQAIFAQCKTEEKRSEIMRLSGQGFLGPALAGIGEDIPTIDSYLTLPIPPFSDVCGHLPFDSTLLANNINITITFESNPNIIYGGSATHPQSFSIAECMMRQGKLSNQSASIRAEMVNSPNLKYSLPMTHLQYWSSSSFAGKRRSDGQCQVELNTFSNADLCGVSFWVIRDDFKNPTANFTPNPYVTDNISDVLVTFGGSTLFNFPGESYKLTNMLVGEQNASYFHNQLMVGNSALTFAASPVDCYMVFLDFARVRSACLPGQLMNVWRIPNNQIRLNFSTSQGPTVNYSLYACYYYNAISEIENGTSSIFID